MVDRVNRVDEVAAVQRAEHKGTVPRPAVPQITSQPSGQRVIAVAALQLVRPAVARPDGQAVIAQTAVKELMRAELRLRMNRAVIACAAIHRSAAAARVERARKAVADCVHALTEEVTFTSGATEANNIAILGAAMAVPVSRRRILISAIEHKSVSAAAFAAERWGFAIEVIPATRDGCINPDSLVSR